MISWYTGEKHMNRWAGFERSIPCLRRGTQSRLSSWWGKANYICSNHSLTILRNKLEELCYIQHYSVVFFHFSLSVGNGKNANQTVFLSCTRCTSSWKVICGRDKGKIGEINKIFTHNSTIVIKDVSVKTTHMKSLDKFLSSNVMLY